ncbi:hypothetical protein PAXRUDRAFT_136090 [Paxillus rubicundulus Ve08.2h10]|uniref:N-acetyltransferase domain-containing protein n=1 Tax=Paxillus rubicundulus Ve08.2h10 TaxID=930991 RepID=A0A0D0E7B2_9AGAM|nr:hypothetical protein PAXRUDRAFT_136090 [Paxillus rubicundulus Ve08.2h10]
MSAVVSRAHRFTSASDLPNSVWDAFRQNESAANIILPFAEKARNSPSDEQNLWIVLYDDSGSVEFVLSCTKGLLGDYPIFIFTPKSSAQLENGGREITQSVSHLVSSLLEVVHPTRVFSVFSIAEVTKQFARIFQETVKETDIKAKNKPYYDATFTFCTKETLCNPSHAISPLRDDSIVISLRRADMSHLGGLTVLCKEFAATSPPYLLDDQAAEREATSLITNQKVWVHMIKKGDDAWDIACLVATTRESDNVTAVTKVYTPERWRKRGCAARLLHRVCQEIFQQKQRVVLYVGNSDDMATARGVYNKVGFQGLNRPGGDPVEGVEQWLEIGFEPTTRGFW